MCIVFANTSDGCLLVGANREEQFDRPFGPPVLIQGEFNKILIAGSDRGPKNDSEKIGTWLGVNDCKMVVAVTNRHDGKRGIKPKKSRGLLTMELLDLDDLEIAVNHAFAELDCGHYGPSNYFIANHEKAYLISCIGKGQALKLRLEFGDHAVANLDMDDLTDKRVSFIRKKMQSEHGGFFEMASGICSHRRIIKTDPDHTTRCSSVIVIGPRPKFYHSMNAPTKNESYEDMSSMLPF